MIYRPSFWDFPTNTTHAFLFGNEYIRFMSTYAVSPQSSVLPLIDSYSFTIPITSHPFRKHLSFMNNALFGCQIELLHFTLTHGVLPFVIRSVAKTGMRKVIPCFGCVRNRACAGSSYGKLLMYAYSL